MDINRTEKNEVGVFEIMIASGPVIIQKRDGVLKTLLVKHGDKPASELKWKFCGGRVLKDMNPEDNAIREAKEEIGIEVKLIRPLKTIILWNEIPETGSINPQAIVLLHYLAEINSEPIAGQDIKEMGWFDVDNLPNDCQENVRTIINSIKV
jgi:ADP-ribose pyrophosphatase YjhB (NUDIX family)